MAASHNVATEDLATLVHAEQVATVYRLAPFTLVMSVVAATLAWGILDWATSATSLGVWLLGHHVVILGRYVLVRAFDRAAPGPGATRRWGKWFVCGAMASGLVWGLIGTVFRPPVGHDLGGVAIVIVIAVGAVGLFTLGQLFVAYVGLAVPLLAPALVALMVSDGAAERSYGIVLGVFAFVAVSNARRGARTFADSIRLRMELVRTAEEREHARATAEAASRAKSQFLAIMSHEIRTPMNGIVGMAELIASSRLDDRQRRYIEALHRSAENLLDIINDVLDLSKIEAGRLELAATDFDLRASLTEVMELMRVRADKKGLVLELDVADAVPARVHGDQIRLRQVIMNLVGNAIKFTERGTVHVAVAPEHGTEAPFLRFEITDTGIGLTKEQSGRIFQAFTQGDASHTRKYGGTGLGLAISRELVTLMGGKIGVSSVSGRGSMFWFTAALAPAFAPSSETTTAELAPLPGLEGHVLLVEDNEVNQIVARGMLEALGLTVTVATNGLEAVQALARRAYDLVLMDCQMPELDGFEATRRIRMREAVSTRSAHATIVALTANAATTDRERCIAAGMDDYLSKPFRMSDLHATASRWLRTARPAARSANASSVPRIAPLTSETIDPTVLDASALDRLRAVQRPGQPDIVDTVVGLFVDRSTTLFAAFREAVSTADAVVARRIAHSLKSNCTHVGANGLAALFKHAERAAGDADLDTVARLIDLIEPALGAVRTELSQAHRPGAGPAPSRTFAGSAHATARAH